jgi:hypothetical protein
MFTSNTHDYIFRQAGLIQKGDINTGIHDSILRKAALMQFRQEYWSIRSSWKRNNPIRRIIRMIQGLIFRDRHPIWKRKRKQYRPSTTVPRNSQSV